MSTRPPHRYPGFPNYGTNQGIRGSATAALRSTITPRIVNEAHIGFTHGSTLWYCNIPSTVYNGVNGIADLGGYSWTPSGMSSVSWSNGAQRRNPPNKTLSDNLNWSAQGNHNLSLGMSFEHRAGWMWNSIYAMSLGMGVSTTYDPAAVMFDSNNYPTNFPNATSSQASSAQSIYRVPDGSRHQHRRHCVSGRKDRQLRQPRGYHPTIAPAIPGHLRTGFLADASEPYAHLWRTFGDKLPVGAAE